MLVKVKDKYKLSARTQEWEKGRNIERLQGESCRGFLSGFCRDALNLFGHPQPSRKLPLQHSFHFTAVMKGDKIDLDFFFFIIGNFFLKFYYN